MSAMLFFMEFVDMVAMAIAQLGGEIKKNMCGEVYDIAKNTILIIVKELCSKIEST